MCSNCKKYKCMKEGVIMPNVSLSIECKKVYYILNQNLVDEIDKLIEEFNKKNGSATFQTLDGGVIPKPPKPGDE